MNFYNEIDKGSAQWLRNLIEAGEIPKGVVDERSIVDIEPEYLDQFTQCHFFAGIGGWSYALRLAHWPRDRKVWTGSCPCQPFSVAGEGKGLEDERHLWPAFRWLISQCRPATVFGEQVASADGRNWASGVRDDLEVMGYDVGLADLCAPGVGADHIRQRLFWGAGMADSGGNGSETRLSGSERSNKERISGKFINGGGQCVDWNQSIWWPCRDDKWRRIPARRVGNAGSNLTGSSHGGTCGGTRDGSSNKLKGSEIRNDSGNDVHDGGIYNTSSTGQQISDAFPLDEPNSCGGSERSSRSVQDAQNGQVEVEPSLFPLADGVSGGVAVECPTTGTTKKVNRRAALFGAGNAIVPELASQFIQASEEALA